MRRQRALVLAIATAVQACAVQDRRPCLLEATEWVYRESCTRPPVRVCAPEMVERTVCKVYGGVPE